MKLRRVGLIYAVVLAVLLIPSLVVAGLQRSENTAFIDAKRNLPSTNLSRVSVEGLQPGKPILENPYQYEYAKGGWQHTDVKILCVSGNNYGGTQKLDPPQTEYPPQRL